MVRTSAPAQILLILTKYMEIKCFYCGGTFTIYNHLKSRKFCTKECRFTWFSKTFKGSGNPFYGKTHNQKTLDHFSEMRIGKPSPRKGKKSPSIVGDKNPAKRPEVREKLRNRIITPEQRIKMSKIRNSWTLTQESKDKISKTLSGRPQPWHRGEKCNFWAGGTSEKIYPREFNKVLKKKIRQRDNFTCCICGRTEQQELEEFGKVLAVNHIDFNKQNCKEENLNTLCCRCNVVINANRQHWTEFFQKKSTYKTVIDIKMLSQ